MINKMKERKKKILTIFWKVAGIAILAWFIFWFIKVKILNQYGLVSNAIMFAVSLACSVIYIIITGILLLIKLKKSKKK
jgi:hypothetical protein